MARLVWQHACNCLVGVATSGPVSDEDLRPFLKVLERDFIKSCLTVAKGSPNIDSRQRHLAFEVLKRRGIPVAVVTDSRVTAGVVTALRWLGAANIRSFHPNTLQEALPYLGLPPKDEAAVFLAVEQCERILLGSSRTANLG